MFNESEKYFDQLIPYDLLVGTIFSAPAACDPMPPLNSENFDEIVGALDTDELWRVGNSYLKRGELRAAEKYYDLLQKKDSSIYQVVAIRGLVWLFLGDLKKSETLLKKALIKDRASPEINLWLGFNLLKQNRLRGITKYFEISELSNDQLLRATSLFLKYFCYVKKEKSEDAFEVIGELEQFPNIVFIRQLLVLSRFFKGKEYFENGEVTHGCSIWSTTFKEFNFEWIRDPHIYGYFQKLSNKNLHFLSLRQNKNSFYEKTLEKLIHLNLIPEFFEDPVTIQDRKKYWKSQIDLEGTYPYAFFRYGLCLLYLGELDSAYEVLSICRDKIPASKIGFFRIDQIIEWLRDIQHLNRHPTKSNDEENITKFSLNTTITSNGWQNYFLTETEALEWINQDFPDPSVAKRWSNLGAKPVDAKLWSIVFKNNDSLAFTFYAAGFRDAEVALKWSKRFSVPVEAWECYKSEQENSNFSQN